jgi:hypothetical protein
VPRTCQTSVFAVDVDMLVFDPLVVALSAVSFAVRQEADAELWDTWVDDVVRLDLRYDWRRDHVIVPDRSEGFQCAVEKNSLSSHIKRHVQKQYADVRSQTQITATFFDFDFGGAVSGRRTFDLRKEFTDDLLTCYETLE